MTNEQAQRARRNIIDNDEAYADWAVRKGLINEDERDSFKAGVRRKMELKYKRGRGTLTAAEADEGARLDRSRVGRAVDAATAQNHLDKGNAPVASAEQARSAISAASSLGESRKAAFQSAPDLNNVFASAAPPGSPVFRQSPGPVAPEVRATGLDL